MDVWPGLRRALNAAGDVAYAAYAWMLRAPLVWTAAVGTARPAWCWRSSGWFARLFLHLARVSIAVQGRENLPGDEPYVVVANHASYLDGLVLVAALRQTLNFIAKRELGEQFFAGTFPRRIGARFVERFDPQHGAEDAGRLIELARRKHSLGFSPGRYVYAGRWTSPLQSRGLCRRCPGGPGGGASGAGGNTFRAARRRLVSAPSSNSRDDRQANQTGRVRLACRDSPARCGSAGNPPGLRRTRLGDVETNRARLTEPAWCGNKESIAPL
jgi:1-acyl-sn-glycerol-3-phosphate acyltransferase